MRYFVAVAEELHFGRAAQRLNISQPPLSQQILNLEQDLGVLLFDRTNRRVTLTAAGRELLDRARGLLRGAEEARHAVGRAGRGEIGRLSIGFVHSAGYGVLPFLVGPFRERHPEVILTLHEMTGPDQVEALKERRIDVGIIRPPPDSSELEWETVIREPFVLAVPAKHRLGVGDGSTNVHLSEVAEEPFITFPRHRSIPFFNQIMTLCTQSGFTPRPAQEVNTIHTALGLVGAGIGVALVPASVQHIHAANVIFRSLDTKEPMAEIALAWRKEAIAPALQLFLEAARALV